MARHFRQGQTQSRLGGRLPDPSILRTHPRTADRVERLMALKKAPVDAGSPIPQKPLVRRPSLVPKIVRRSAARGRRDHDHYAGLLSAYPVDPVIAAADAPAAGRSLNPPSGKPKVRIWRGGVWW